MKYLTLRLALDLHERIKAEADKAHRSFNAQVVHILAEWVAQQKGA